jgi:lipopolysaccharide export system permease protein
MHLVVLAIIALLFLWRLNVNSRCHPLVMWSAVKHARLLKNKKTIKKTAAT